MYVVQKSDYEPLAGFLSENELLGKSTEYWLSRFSYWWDINPAFQNGMDRGWIIKKGADIVGFAGAIPAFFQYNGETIRVFNGTTWVVKPEYRGEQSLNLFLKALKNAQGTAYFDTTSTGKIAKIKILSKFKYMFSSKGIKEYLYIIKPKALFNSKFKSNFLSILLFIFFSPVNFIFKICVNFILPAFYEIKLITGENTDFESLWTRTKQLYLNTNVRNTETLNWLLYRFPGPKRIVLGCYKNEELLGFAICLDMSETKIRKLVCADVWYDFNNDRILKSLMKGCIKYGKDNCFDVVVMPGFNTKIEKVFKKLVFNVRAGKNYFYKFDPEETNPLVPENTYFVYLQGDFGLY